MGTALSDVYDLMMMNVTDYRLNQLFSDSVSDFEDYLEGWLIYAISDFKNCTVSLAYDSVTKLFDATLSQTDIVILATLMTKYWMRKNVNDITQMNLHLTDRDFKMASEANNLREKRGQLKELEERCSQMLIDYGYENVDWDEWFNQNYAGS